MHTLPESLCYACILFLKVAHHKNRYFSSDIHFVSLALSAVEQELALPWAVSVLMNYPLATVQIIVKNRFRFGLLVAPALEVRLLQTNS